MPPVGEQMKAWSAALAAEVSDWPKVTARSFFGFTAFYRGESMFAALPRTRAMLTPNSLVLKLPDAGVPLQKRLTSDPRIGSMNMNKARWYTFELTSDSDLHDALDWISRAYDAAKARTKNKKKQR